MATVRSFFSGFVYLFLLLFVHLGCFFCSCDPNPNHQPSPKRRKISPASNSPPSSSASLKPQKSLSLSIRSYLNHLFSSRKPNKDLTHHPPPTQPISSTQPVPSSPGPAEKNPSGSGEKPDISAETGTKLTSFASRSDIFPCPACGEVLGKAHLLDLHQTTRHSLSELCDGDSGKKIVQIIFQSGWKGKIPAVHRILKIHHSPKTLARFEEYRDVVRSRAARLAGRRGDERCIADGNERLRFYCSTVLCSLGRDAGSPAVCGSQFCSTCGIVRHGFSGKQLDLDGIATHASSWGAHVSLPEDLEEEFAFLHVRRAMLVCRVVAGRVARGGEEGEEKGFFDSVVPVRPCGGGSTSSLAGDEELLVFNLRAVLPCFVILYTA